MKQPPTAANKPVSDDIVLRWAKLNTGNFNYGSVAQTILDLTEALAASELRCAAMVDAMNHIEAIIDTEDIAFSGMVDMIREAIPADLPSAARELADRVKRLEANQKTQGAIEICARCGACAPEHWVPRGRTHWGACSVLNGCPLRAAAKDGGS